MGLPSRRRWVTILTYLVSIVAGASLALISAQAGVPDHIYAMLAVLLVVSAALVGGTGPAIVASITTVIGDDAVLTGRLPALEQWRDEVLFGTIAVVVGLLVSAKRRQQMEADRLALLERALRTERDRILSVIAHDVRNPLSVIAGTAQQGIMTAGANPAMARLFRRIKSAADQSADLVDTLADLRSVDGNAIELNRQRRDLRRTVDAAVDQMEALRQNHTLRLSLPDQPVVAEYDERRIQRVLQNLIGNAIKYSPDGGSIDIETHATASEARITVRDRGMGIPPAARPHVFERGFRAETVGVIPGSGLGLFISSEIVKRHGGTISCVAPLDGGTLMEVRLPLARVGEPPESVQKPPGHGPGPPVSDRTVVDHDDGDGFARRAGQKRLVRAE
jgi:signal transduction histidine kinase